MNSIRRFPILACFLAGVVLLGMLCSPLRAEKPVALVGGDAYGHSEVKALIEQVLRQLPDVVYEECGDFLEAESFSGYRLVVLAGENSSRAYTHEEARRIEEYLRQGGRILLIRQAPSLFPVLGEASDPKAYYPFGKTVYIQGGVESAVEQPDAKILAGALPGDARPFWLKGNVLLRGQDWEPLIAADGSILVGQKELESGRVFYVGSELFRLRGQAGEHGAGDLEGWIAILKNILSGQ